MIVDSLTHVTPNGKWFHTDYDAGEDRLLREMDAAQVDHAVVVALADFISNEFVLEVCNRHAGRLLPGASFNPVHYASSAQAARAFRSELQNSPFRVLKLHPRFNKYDPLDPRCLAVIEETASWEKPFPIWLDTIFYFQGGSLRKPPVDTVHELVCRFPTLKFVLLHSGGTLPLQFAEAVRDCPNAYLDISLTMCRYACASTWLDLRFLVSRFDRRTVCGSDFPEYGMTDVMQHFQRLTEGLPREKTENLLGGNLSNILSMPELNE